MFPVPVSYPTHCYNHSLGDGETGVDCGGQCAPCWSNQACTQASDCLSNQCASNKTCVPLITALTYTPIEIGAQTPRPKFNLSFTYSADSAPDVAAGADGSLLFQSQRGGGTDRARARRSTIDPGNSQSDISTKVLTSVHRFPLPAQDPNVLSTDSYLEIAFNDSMTVTPGTKFTFTEDFVAGNIDQLFDQNSHYSFTKTTGANQALTVHRGSTRLWGVEPPMALFPECAFAFGVNVNGPALTVGAESLVAESEAQLTFSGSAPYSNTTVKPLPTSDAATTTLLSTARTLNTGDSVVRPVPNGKYWAYAWLTSSAPSATGTLSFGATVADKFVGYCERHERTLGADRSVLGGCDRQLTAAHRRWQRTASRSKAVRSRALTRRCERERVRWRD